MADLLDEKLQLQREVSVARARVEKLRQLERLEELCRGGNLPLKAPVLPPLFLGTVEDAAGTTRHNEGRSTVPSREQWSGLAMAETEEAEKRTE